MSNDLSFRFAIIDIETTGLKVTRDRITEIAVTIMTNYGIEKSWQTLINPNIRIPAEITSLTGITNEMVSLAPTFEEKALELFDFIEGAILVAHNIRFDYAFLKNAFKQCGIDFRPKLVCTLKLARNLYPTLSSHSLNYLQNYLSLESYDRHRAASDVALLVHFLQRVFNDFSQETVLKLIAHFSKEASIPSKLKTDLSAIPDSPGVYLFYSDSSDLPIYIGKSIALRQRVLSHFQTDYAIEKEFKMAQSVNRVEFIETTGELSALLLESKLIKDYLPLYNQRLRKKKSLAGFRLKKVNGYLEVDIAKQEEDSDTNSEILGNFSSIAATKSELERLVKEFSLCSKLCKIEKTKHSCFAYQLKRCMGACVQEEPPEEYNQRVNLAFSKFIKASWPYKGAIAIQETHQDKSAWLIFNQWQYLGESSVKPNSSHMVNKPVASWDKDTYKILRQFINSKLDKTKWVNMEEA